MAVGVVAITVYASAQTGINRFVYAANWGKIETNAAFADFNSWANKYTNAPTAAVRTLSVSDGVLLAKKRHQAFAELIKTDPEKAIASTLPASVRSRLPVEVVNELETRVSGIGDYSVLAALPAKGGPPVEPIQRFVHLNSRTYRAYVYGHRLGETCKNGIPLHGVALDGVMALDESSLRELETDEVPDIAKQIIDLRTAVEKSARNSRTTFAQVGEKIYQTTLEQLPQAEARLEAAESGIGPQPLQSAANIMNESGQSGTGIQPRDAPTPWTTGLKKILFIRVDFSDIPGDPVDLGGNVNTAPYIQNIADTEVSPFYLKSSYGLTSLTNTVTSQRYRMPKTGAYYETNGGPTLLHADAEAAASANYTLTNYDRIVVVFPLLSFGFSGEGELGGLKVWINGGCNGYLLDHELGHTYGVYHGNLWQVSDGNPVSANGSSIEYGDYYNTMGSGAFYPSCDFCPWFKNIFGWISDTQVQTVTASGTYRIYAFDYENYAAARGETLALKIVRDSIHNYWIGCLGNFTNNPSMENGAYVTWGYDYLRQCDLLDMTTPGTIIEDAALAKGAIFTDSETNITIRTVAQGGIAPNKYLDVQISFGPNPPLPPMITMTASNQAVTLGDAAVFTIAETGNPAPSYRWQFQLNGSTNWINLNDEENYAGSQTATLTVTPPSMALNGILVRCIVANASGSVTSSPPAVLTVNAPLVINTLAGLAGNFGYADGAGTNASFYFPWGVAVDNTGTNIYVTDSAFGLVRKISPAGVVSTFANSFSGLRGIAVDNFGNVYVAASYDQTIQRITPAGTVSVLAGLTGSVGSVDGTNTDARFKYPQGIAVDSSTNIYVADTYNNEIRKITPNENGTQWIVSTIAGTTNSGSLDGIGTNAQFNFPESIAVDSATNIYVADTFNNEIRKITPNATGTRWLVTTIAGGSSGTADGIGTNAQFLAPFGISVNNVGTLYVSDTANQTIRKVELDVTKTNWVVTTIAGGISGSADGTGTNAQFDSPIGIAVDNTTNVYITDQDNGTIRLGRFASVVVPTLQMTPTANKAMLSWPIPTANFVLESTTNLALTNWTVVTPDPSIINGQNFVTNSKSSGARFYRLRK